MSFTRKHEQTGCGARQWRVLASRAAANELAAEGGTLLRCVGGCCTQTGDRGLKEKHFSGFSHTHRLFSSVFHTQQTDPSEKHEEPAVLGCAGRDDHPADGAR